MGRQVGLDDRIEIVSGRDVCAGGVHDPGVVPLRNREAVDQANVVVLGDSLTYGFGVLATEAFPNRLGAYNMGIGSYGPLEYSELARQVAELKPRHVIVAIYTGNDIHDAHRVARREPFADVRDPTVRYKPPKRNAPTSGRNLVMRAVLAAERKSRGIGWLTTTLRRQLYTQAYLASVYASEDGAPAYSGGRISTRFTPAHRNRAMDLSRRNVADGLRITRIALQRIKTRVAVPVTLLIIPTKERVYAPIAGLDDTIERTLTASITRDAEELGYDVMDATPALTEALRNDRPIYFTNADGHLAPEGHAVIADYLKAARKLP